ncbi:unnamed protein product [Ectocarpus fasciculatus]
MPSCERTTLRQVSVLTAFLLALAVSCGQRTVNVSPNTNNNAIQTALDDAQPGDTIILGAGNYYESPETTVDGLEGARITIIGEDVDSVRLLGEGTGTRVLEIKHDYYTVEGFTIDGEVDTTGTDYLEFYHSTLIYAYANRTPTIRGNGFESAMDGLIIKNMKLRTAGEECLRLRGWVNWGLIEGNDIQDCGKWDFVHEDQTDGEKKGEGVCIGTSSSEWGADGIDDCRGNIVRGNYIETNGGEGVDVKEGVIGTIVDDNVVQMQLDGDSGAIGSRASGTIICNNYIKDAAGAGVTLGGNSVNGIVYGIDNEVWGNTMEDCRAFGVKISVAPQGDICDNDITLPSSVAEEDYLYTGGEAAGDIEARDSCARQGCHTDSECPDGLLCCLDNLVCLEPEEGGNPAACGDPHMTGFLGQKFDFTGVDGEWYCLVSDLPSMHLSMRVTAPVASMPDITYITGLSVITTDGEGQEHSIVISVKDPHSLESACPVEGSPCLADGALSVTLDGEEKLFAPGTVALGEAVTVSAANLPGACRSFGFEQYWEKKMLEYAGMHGRRLATEQSMAEWILGDPTATNMEECVDYVAHAEVREGGLFAHQSEHASFQIAAPAATIRLTHGRLHQVAMRDPTDHFDLPDHRTWQMNMGIERNNFSQSARGILGETFVPTKDAHGNRIMSGMEAIRGETDDYRVDGPLGIVFALDSSTH